MPTGMADTCDVPCGRQGFETFHHVAQGQYLRRGGSPWPPVFRLVIWAGTGTRPYGMNQGCQPGVGRFTVESTLLRWDPGGPGAIHAAGQRHSSPKSRAIPVHPHCGPSLLPGRP